MEFVSFKGGEDNEPNDVSCVEISCILSMQDAIFVEARLIWQFLTAVFYEVFPESTSTSRNTAVLSCIPNVITELIQSTAVAMILFFSFFHCKAYIIAQALHFIIMNK